MPGLSAPVIHPHCCMNIHPRLSCASLLTWLAWGAALDAEAPTSFWRPVISVVEERPDGLRLVYEAGRESISWLGESPPLHAAQIRNMLCACAIGVPLDAEVELNVVEARVVARLDIEEAEKILSDEDALVRADGPVAVDETGFARSQRIARVAFAPGLNEQGEILLYDRVVVDVSFSYGKVEAPTGGASVRRDRWGEMMYRQMVINYDQARKWRLPHRGSASKVTQQPPAEGTRLRIVVRGRPGMYKVTGQDMIDAGVRLEDVEADRIRFLYGGGSILGRAKVVSSGIDLRETAIVVEDGDDGSFDREDFVLFYGQPPSRWEYNRSTGLYRWRQNLYTKDNVYFLEFGSAEPGPRAAIVDGSPGSGGIARSDRYRERLRQEGEFLLLRLFEQIPTGYDWYWEAFNGNARNFPTVLRDVAPEEPVVINLRFWGGDETTHRFAVSWNDQPAATVRFNGSESRAVTALQGAREGRNELGLIHEEGHEEWGSAKLDWYELEYSRRLVAVDGELAFNWDDAVRHAVRGNSDNDDDGDGAAGEFHLSGFPERPRIFVTSEVFAMKEIVDFTHDTSDSTVVFRGRFAGVIVPPRYVVSPPEKWRRPARIEIDPASQLKSPNNGADYVIITHADFRQASARLAAWRAQDDRFGAPMNTAVVDVADIYDEFSGGLLDPMAIRSFVNYAVDNWDPAPFFILLVGDGTYDYKNNSLTSHTNWIPAYQDGDHMYDEWYVRIEGEDRLPDLAIGRLPVQTAAQAEGLVDKIIGYDRSPEVGPWQVRSLLVSDDVNHPQKPGQREEFFIIDSETMARSAMPEDLNLEKLYIGHYPLEGRTKPKARDEFIRQFNAGALILTFVGHGNPGTLAHERMFVLSRDLDDIDNGGRLPLMYTAASQVGVFDDPARVSIPEALLNRADGGVIGFISATRVGYHTSNMVLAIEFHRHMYRSDETHVPVGLALTAAKVTSVVPEGPHDRGNVQRYSLLGDPAMRLARPRYKIGLNAPNSLSALEEVRLEGEVLAPDGQPDRQFSGSAWIQVFDSSARAQVEGQDYEQIGAPIFRSLAVVEEGRFEAIFRVPKDINYNANEGRLSAYVWGDRRPAAFGALTDIFLSGTAASIEPDDEGPTITVGFKGQAGFRSGDFVSPRPIMETLIEDAGGINITGEPGHHIVLTLDGETFNVTEFFSNRQGNYQSGVLEYELPELEPGTHEIRLKAWDGFNNSAKVELEVEVSEEGDSPLSDMLFFPNPMRDQGHFTYILSVPAQTVHISVFTLAGKLVEQLEVAGEPGYNQIAWNPREPLANGSYLYRIKAIFASGAQIETTDIVQVVQ